MHSSNKRIILRKTELELISLTLYQYTILLIVNSFSLLRKLNPLPPCRMDRLVGQTSSRVPVRKPLDFVGYCRM